MYSKTIMSEWDWLNEIKECKNLTYYDYLNLYCCIQSLDCLLLNHIVVYLCIIFYSMHRFFALTVWRHGCIEKKGVKHLGLFYREVYINIVCTSNFTFLSFLTFLTNATSIQKKLNIEKFYGTVFCVVSCFCPQKAD